MEAKVFVSKSSIMRRPLQRAKNSLCVSARNRKKVVDFLTPFCGSITEAQLIVSEILEEKRVAFAKAFLSENQVMDFNQVFDTLNEFFQKPGQAITPTVTERVIELAMKELDAA